MIRVTTRTLRGVPDRISRRALVCLALATAVGVGIAVWQLEEGAAAQPSFPVVKAFREDLIVSVGGVGRIIEAKTPGQIGIGSASATVGSAPAGSRSGRPR